jgi:hypothetical protein
MVLLSIMPERAFILPMTFQNRILSYGVKPADQFLANPANPRIHPQFQRQVMQAALSTVGFVAPVIETRDGYLLDGHERIFQALEDNSEVPYVVVDMDSSDPDAAYVLATFDPITSLANYDAGRLDELLKEVNSDNAAVQQMLAQVGTSAGLYVPGQSPYDEWQGMPEFEQENQLGLKQIIVHFNSEADVQAFATLIEQTITMQTKYIWYPKQDKLNAKVLIATDES